MRVQRRCVGKASLLSGASLLATTGLIASVWRGENGEQNLQLTASNCEDWNKTRLSLHLKLVRSFSPKTDSETIFAEVERTLPGDWQNDQPWTPPIADQPGYIEEQKDGCGELEDRDGALVRRRSRRFDSFLGAQTAADMMAYVFKGVSLGEMSKKGGAQCIVSYPLFEMLNDWRREKTSLQCLLKRPATKRVWVSDDEMGARWIEVLRATKLSESQIASYGPELLYQARKSFDPELGITIDEAVKDALYELQLPGRLQEIREAYKAEEWDWAGLEDFKISVLRQDLRDVADCHSPSKLRCWRESTSQKLTSKEIRKVCLKPKGFKPSVFALSPPAEAVRPDVKFEFKPVEECEDDCEEDLSVVETGLFHPTMDDVVSISSTSEA